MANLFVKKWVFLIAITVSSFIIGLRTDIYFFYFFFWFLVSIFLISLGWLALEFFGVEVRLSRKCLHKVNEDDFLDIEIDLQNKSPLPVFNPILKDSLACASRQEREKLVLLDDVKPNSSLRLDYSCLCPQRGRYRLGPLSLYLFDPFCLFFLKKVIPVYSEVYVYPKTFKIKQFPPLSRGILPWFGINSSRRQGEEDEFFGVREYAEGDPIRRIHWFSSAKKGRLIVKQFQNQNFPRASIIFNLEKDKNFGEGKQSVCEYTIRLVASVSKYLIKENISLEIIANTGQASRIPFNKSLEHLDDIFKFLTLAQPESKVSLAELFEEYSPYISNDTNLIVVTLDEDWKKIPLILPLEKRNISLIPLILISSSFMQGAQCTKQEILKSIESGLSGALNFKPVFFSCGDNIEEVFAKSLK